MKSERTAKELEEFLDDCHRDPESVAAFLGVELAPERPAAEKRPEWWGRPIPGHADPYYSTVDTLALVDAYEAARKAGVLPGLEAQSQELGNPWLNQVAVTEAAVYREWQAGRNRAMADLTFGGGGVVWCEEAEPAAPERPALPGWAEEGIEISMGEDIIRVKRSGGDPIDTIAVVEGRPHSANAALLAALVEVHRRWLTAKRELERLAGRRVLPANACHALDILRGEEVG